MSALNDEQLDRAAGVLLAQACGDALGVPYEGRPPGAVDGPPVMKGGGLGPYEPAEWSDDTEMALCIADALCADAVPGGDVCADAVPDGDACADAGMGHGGAPDHSLVRDHALV
ncbi:MAG TPA: ADP-ribosylglycohydrolase family protein, partial [Thermoleophilia bacterium]|nr:ADP-ribosylglycohydrolase family protein [Thermoleophilia bacterium]